MLPFSMKKEHRQLEKLIKAMGITDVQFVHGGKHVRIFGRCGDKEITATASSTLSDKRGTLNLLSDIRSQLRD